MPEQMWKIYCRIAGSNVKTSYTLIAASPSEAIKKFTSRGQPESTIEGLELLGETNIELLKGEDEWELK